MRSKKQRKQNRIVIFTATSQKYTIKMQQGRAEGTESQSIATEMRRQQGKSNGEQNGQKILTKKRRRHAKSNGHQNGPKTCHQHASTPSE
jgi:hypothetical protein